MEEMNLDQFIKYLEGLREVQGGNLNIAVQVPPGTKCWEQSWTQFSIDCISDDGGTVYLQCSKQ